MIDPFHAGYLAGAESRTRFRSCVRVTMACPHMPGTLQQRIWREGLAAYFDDVTHRWQAPRREPEYG